MAKRRGFDQLSPAYQRRLTRAGITPQGYATGANIKAARGHARTPERPAQFFRAPHKFPEYARARDERAGIVPPQFDVNGPRFANDDIGYPGKRSNISTAIFTLQQGYAGSEYKGTITFITYSDDRQIISERTVEYRMSEFKALVALAKQRGYITQVVSTTGGFG